MSNDKMREAFEADYSQNWLGGGDLFKRNKLKRGPGGSYVDPETAAAWWGYQQSQQPEIEPVDDWLVYCLEYIGAGDPDDIECDDYELYAENDEGQSGTITVSISETCRKAATALQGPQLSAQVPEGYALVPKEITEDMAGAYFGVIDKNLARVSTDCRFGRYDSQKEAYRAMLAAAPSMAEKENNDE